MSIRRHNADAWSAITFDGADGDLVFKIHTASGLLDVISNDEHLRTLNAAEQLALLDLIAGPNRPEN